MSDDHLKYAPWMREAHRLLALNIAEIPGPKANSEIVALFKDAKFAGVKSDETAWCAAAACGILERSGIRSPRSLRALSFSEWGQALAVPYYGCIAWKTRDGGGHTAFVVGWNKTHVWLLGGNQKDRFMVSKYRRSDIGGYRWPAGYPLPPTTPDLLVYSRPAESAGKES